MVKEIQKDIIQELKSEFPEAIHDETESLLKALMQIHSATKRKFFIIIDEGCIVSRSKTGYNYSTRIYTAVAQILFKKTM